MGNNFKIVSISEFLLILTNIQPQNFKSNYFNFRFQYTVLCQRKLRVRHLACHEELRALPKEAGHRHLVLHKALLPRPIREHGQAPHPSQGLIRGRNHSVLDTL